MRVENRDFILNLNYLNPLTNGLYSDFTGVPEFDDSQTDFVELHVLDSNNNVVNSNHSVDNWSVINNQLKLDIYQNFSYFGLYSGRYGFLYKYLRSLVGIPNNNIVLVDKISDSRTEVRLVPGIDMDTTQLGRFNSVPFINKTYGFYKVELLLNFGSNKTYDVTNWKLDDFTYTDRPALILKTKTPISDDIKEGKPVAINIQLANDIYDSINLVPSNESRNVTVLGPPNWNAKSTEMCTKKETTYDSWNRLLTEDDNVSYRIINQYFSGSEPMTLNVDYRDFNNYVFYSSAERRLNIFKTKLELIESYDASITALNNFAPVSASITSSFTYQDDINSYVKNKNTIIGGFNNYERYLYYSSGSYETSSFGEWNDTTWPKQNSISPYTLYSVTSSIATDWYNVMIESASFYDKNNQYTLLKTIPEWIVNDEYNDVYLDFVHLIAQQFDDIWLYISHSINITNRDESLYNGMSKDLVYYVLNSMGWEVENNNQFDELWQYFLATDHTGQTQYSSSFSPSSSIIYVETGSLSSADINKEIWKRILNNIPYILKTKGTEQSIQAILNCYGIPPTILRIREYGGPEKLDTNSTYKYDKFNYALCFNGINEYVEIPKKTVIETGRTPDAFEFRFKTINPHYNTFTTSQSYQSLLRTDSGSISFNIEYVSGSGGSLTMTYALYSASVLEEGKFTPISSSNIFDGKWWSLLVNKGYTTDNTSSNQMLNVYLKQANYGEVTHEYSGSIDIDAAAISPFLKQEIKNKFYTSSIWYLGGGPSGPSGEISGADQSFLNLYPFTGSMQEFRYWALALSESAFDNHVTSPLSYNFNYSTGSFDNLVYRIPLGSDLNKIISSEYVDDYVDDYVALSEVTSSHPNQNRMTFIDGTTKYALFDLSGSATWLDNVEEYASEWPDMTANRSISNKVRIESSSLLGDLNVNKRKEESSYDKYPIDNAKIGVYFSPTNEVDEDIAHDFGGINIDDYIGDPVHRYENYYPDLEYLRRHYFKKYLGQYGVQDYIRLVKYFDQTVWKQIKKSTPARSDTNVGLVIEPHLLNRSKISLMRNDPVVGTFMYSGSLTITQSLSGSCEQYSGTIDASDIWTITSSFSNDDINLSVSGTIITNDLVSTGENLNSEYTELSYRLVNIAETGSGTSDYCWSNTLSTLTITGSGIAWTNPNNARYAPDNSYATTSDGISRYLVASNFNINVPSDATINGITVNIVKKATQPANIRDFIVSIDTSSTAEYNYGDNKAKSTVWTTVSESYIYGSPTDLWSQSWTPAAVMSSDFCVKFSASGSLGSKDIFVDSIGVKVAYTTRTLTSESATYTIVNWFTSSVDNPSIQPMITASRASEHYENFVLSGEYWDDYCDEYIYELTRSYHAADVQDFKPLGKLNHMYNGCKISSPDFNVPTTDTPDGGPAVEYFLSNPNEIIVNDGRNKNDPNSDLIIL